FADPRSLAYDGSANLFIADRSYCALRRFELATGTLHTLVGGSCSSSPLSGAPAGLVYVGGALYLVDSQKCVIDEIDPTSGAVTTFAGTANNCADTATTFDGPQALAVDSQTNLYTFDISSTKIRKVTRTSPPVISTFATGVSVTAMVFDKRDTLYSSYEQ